MDMQTYLHGISVVRPKNYHGKKKDLNKKKFEELKGKAIGKRMTNTNVSSCNECIVDEKLSMSPKIILARVENLRETDVRDLKGKSIVANIPQTRVSASNECITDDKLNMFPRIVLSKVDNLRKTNELLKGKSIVGKMAETIVSPSNESNYDDKKKSFLLNLGLIPKVNVWKRGILSAHKNNREAKFCCAGLPNKPRDSLYKTEMKIGLTDKSIDKRIERQPIICLKKWHGNGRVVNSKRKFRLLAKALIPKSTDHSMCKKKIIKLPSVPSFEAGCAKKTISVTEDCNGKAFDLPHSVEFVHSSCNGEVKPLLKNDCLLTNHLQCPNIITIPNGVNDGVPLNQYESKIKNIKICVKQWEEKNGIPD